MRVPRRRGSRARRGEMGGCANTALQNRSMANLACGLLVAPLAARRGRHRGGPRPPRGPAQPSSNFKSTMSGGNLPCLSGFLPALNSRGRSAAGRRHARCSVARRGDRAAARCGGSCAARRGRGPSPCCRDLARWAPAAPRRRPSGTTAGAEVHETPRTRGAPPPHSAAAIENAASSTRGR